MAIWTRRFLLLLFPCLVTLTAAPSLLAAEEQREYIFGSFPFLAQPTLEGIFSPLAAEIGTALGRPIHYESAVSFEKFSANLEQQCYDIAHIHPFDYVQVAAKAGYLPLVTRRETLPAIFVTREDSPLNSAKDLRGKKIGLPPAVATVSYLALVALRQEGLTPGRDVTTQHFSTHQACLQAVLIGDIDACAAGRPIVRVFQAESQHTFKTILTSPEIPQTLFVAHKRVPAAERERIAKALLASRLNGVDPKLRALFLPEAAEKGGYFRPVTDKEYDVVRRYIKMLQE